MSLRIARKIAGLSQKELAERAGVDTAAICRIESGARDLRTSGYLTLQAIASVLKLSVDELVAIAATPDVDREDEDAAVPRKPRTKTVTRSSSGKPALAADRP